MKTSSHLYMSALSALILILLCGSKSDLTAAQQSNPLNWPEITNETRPWTRWWWMGSSVDEKDLTTEMDKYVKAGLGGLEIVPIYGVKGYEDKFIDFLSPQWMEMLDYTLSEADRLGIGIDVTAGTGWPFGGPWVHADTACKNVTYKTYTLKEGQKLSDAVAMMQSPMVRAISGRVDISQLKEPLSENTNLQALALEQVRFAKPMLLEALMAYSDQGRIVNLTGKVDPGGILDWAAPAGNWTLYAVFEGWHGKMVERAAPGAEGNVIDHFSEKALKNYLAKFDQAFAGHDISSLRAFFNDSYEVDDASGESGWTDDFFDQFKKLRGYDLREHLPALFGKDSADNNSRVICDYRETISDLLLEKFTIGWDKWAQSKGAETKNQAHGSPGNLLDLYAASGIPETEGSDIVGIKFASSAAHVTGKNLVSCEAATWLDEHFFASLGDVKPAVDRFFLGGVNQICYHGTTYSPSSEDWPGWLFYASVHFGPTNSFWRDFHALNDYVTRCQSFLQAGKPDNDVLVYFPIYDLWSQPGTSMLVHFRASTPATLADITRKLLQKGYTFDLISDRQINDLKFSDNLLQAGDLNYKALVVPRCNLIPPETFQSLLELAQQGAKIIFENNFPSDVPGLNNLEKRRNDLRNAFSRINFNNADEQEIRIAELGKGKILLGNDIEQMLSAAGIQRETMVDKGVGFVRRDIGDSKCYFILNNSRNAIAGWIPLREKIRSAAIFEPMNGGAGKAAVRTSENNMSEIYVQLSPGETCILKTFDKEIEAPLYKYVRVIGQPEKITGTWTIRFLEGGPELPASITDAQLGSWTNYDGDAVKKFSGTASYKISFKKPENDPDGWILNLGQVCESAQILLNGKDLGTFIGPDFHLLIPHDIMQEENSLEIKVTNLMLNRIIDLDKRGVNWKKFYNTNFPSRIRQTRGPDGQFNASNLSPVDSGLIGPVTLEPIEFLKF